MDYETELSYQENSRLGNSMEIVVDGITYYLKLDSDNKPYYEVIGYLKGFNLIPNETIDYLEIPSSIDGIPVKVIGYCCFSNCNIRKIKIPEGVVEIGKSAFSGCFGLKVLELPNTIRIFNSSLDGNPEIKFISDIEFIPGVFVDNSRVDIGNKEKLLKVLSNDGTIKGIVWYKKYSDFLGNEKAKWVNFINRYYVDEINNYDKDKYAISLDEEWKYFNDNDIDFDSGDLEKFNKIIYLLYPTLNDFPTSIPDFSKMFVNFKEWINLGLDIQYIYDNPNIVFKSYLDVFNNIYNNYNLLNFQNNITSSEMLQKIYFGFTFDSREDLFVKLKESIRNNFKIEPTTIIKLMEDSQDELVKQKLKDSLIYASHIVSLNVDSIDNKTMVELREIIAHDAFENITKSNDEVYKDMYGCYPKKYSLFGNEEDLFEGTHYHIRKDLERINTSFYNINSDVNLSPTEIYEFLKTLNVVKNWDKLSIDKKKRAILLKNEVIGRCLYATMRTALENDENFIQETKEYESEKLAIENNSELSNKKKNKKMDKLDKKLGKKISSIISQMDFYNLDLNECKALFIKHLFYTDFNNKIKDNLDRLIDEEIIKKMIEFNPYTFDMLRNGMEINEYFYKLAFDNNYLFREQGDFNVLKKPSVKDKLKEKQNPFSVIAQYMLNDIENNPKSDSFDKTFAINIRRMLSEYFYGDNVNDEMFLFNIFRGIDAYLGKKYSIDAQEVVDGNVRGLSNKIFDLTQQDKYNNYDRLCYSLFNLNRLAHDIHSISMKKLELDFNRYKNDSVDLSKLQRVLYSYTNLSKIGLMPRDVNFIFEGTKDFASVIMDGSFSNDQKAFLLNRLLPDNVKKLDSSSIDDVVSYFEEIKDVDLNIRSQIELDAEEQRMDYDAKRVVGENFVRMLSEFASNSLDNQKEFFKKYGFVVECQYDVSDRGNDLLVVYNPKFGKTFSIHMKDMDDEIRKIFDEHMKKDMNKTLCCTQVNGGLVEFEQTFIDKDKELIELSPSKFINSGDYDDRELLNASVQFHNFLEYDCEVYKERIISAGENQEKVKRIILELFRNIPMKNFYEVKMSCKNEDDTYSSINILSLICDKIGIRFDMAISILNEVLYQKEEVSFNSSNDRFMFVNYSNRGDELSDMIDEYISSDTDCDDYNKQF